MCIRDRLTTLHFIMGCAPSRAKALAQAEEIRVGLGECMDLAWAHAKSALGMAGITEGKAELFERIAARLLLHIPQKPPRPDRTQPHEGLSGLWQLGISGDLPILLMEVKSLQALRMVKTCLLYTSERNYARRRRPAPPQPFPGGGGFAREGGAP